MPLTPLEIAIYNLAELAAVEDVPPFARLLRRPGSKPAGFGDDELIRLPGKGDPKSGRGPGDD
jgi:hypothetical protein